MLVSISPTFYMQLLLVQIPKSQKKTDNLTVFFVLSGSVCVKALQSVDEIDTWSLNIAYKMVKYIRLILPRLNLTSLAQRYFMQRLALITSFTLISCWANEYYFRYVLLFFRCKSYTVYTSLCAHNTYSSGPP